MSYQIALNSRNVLLPIALEDRNGNRFTSPLAKLDNATAMFIQVALGSHFKQEFFPLKIVLDNTKAYGGIDWELWSQNMGENLYCYYLGIPNVFFQSKATGKPTKSLSVQIVGSSPLTGGHDFSGGVDINLHSQVMPPLIPGFLNLSERFFPTLLPNSFIESFQLDFFEFQNRREIIGKVALQLANEENIPISLGKHWEPKNWLGAVIENICPQGYFTIKGGCFYSRANKISHWFGASIGLQEKDFRKAGEEQIQKMGSSGAGSWIFWLEVNGINIQDLDSCVDDQKKNGCANVSIRHPMVHKMLAYKKLPNQEIPSLKFWGRDLDISVVVSALTKVAQILVGHQAFLHSSKSEPEHGVWSQIAPSSYNIIKDFSASETKAKNPNPFQIAISNLEKDIQALYNSDGEMLRILEAQFDEAYGYLPWDTIGNPLREALTEFLTNQNLGTKVSVAINVANPSESETFPGLQ